MMLRRTAATVAVLGAIAAAGAPIASAAPKPDPNNARAVPGTSCNVGQLRAAINRSSPGLTAKLDQVTGGSKQFADIATGDPNTRQFQLAALVFTGSAAGFGILAEQQNVRDALSNAYKTCNAPAKKK